MRIKRKKLLEFIAWFAKRRGEFSMLTPCIADYVAQWQSGERVGRNATLQNAFGLSYDVADNLYIAIGFPHDLEHVTKKDALQALRKVASVSAKDLASEDFNPWA